VPVVDAQPDQVFLGFVAQRESKLLADFLAAARAAARHAPSIKPRLTVTMFFTTLVA
jgi:hypothetical protein